MSNFFSYGGFNKSGKHTKTRQKEHVKEMDALFGNMKYVVPSPKMSKGHFLGVPRISVARLNPSGGTWGTMAMKHYKTRCFGETCVFRI